MDTNNAAGLPDFEISLRTGWKDEEKLLLWDEVKKAQKIGAPLKRVSKQSRARRAASPTASETIII